MVSKNVWISKNSMKCVWVSPGTHEALCQMYSKGDSFDKVISKLISHWNKVDSHESKPGVGGYSYNQSDGDRSE